LESDLDRIPYPDFSLLKPDPHRRKFPAPIPVQTSRGCPFDCSFCSVTGMLVLGFEEDDWSSVKKTVRFAKRSRLSTTQFLILTPLPGSEFYEKMSAENRLRFHDWALYDAHRVVFEPARFSLFDLQKAQMYCHKKFYSWRQTAGKVIAGQWLSVGIAHYARKLNRMWTKRNRTFLKVIALLKSKTGARISVEYREEVSLEP